MIAYIPIVVSDAELMAISEANPGWQVERESDGSLVMSPRGSLGGARSALVLPQLQRWNERHGFGYVFDSSTGFTMPDRAVLSPDASWIAKVRWDSVSRELREGYAPIVPDIAIELVSASDRVENVRRKAARYIAYGASYVVVIDPFAREHFAYGDRPAELAFDFDAIYAA